MLCRQLSPRIALLVLASFGAGMANGQDATTDLLRLGRAFEGVRARQGPQPPALEKPFRLNDAAASAEPANQATIGVPEAVGVKPAAASEQARQPQDEAMTLYEAAKREGRSDEDAWILGQLAGYVRQLHEAAAGRNELAFKNLKIGAEFPMNIGGTGIPVATGRTVVSLEDGTAPEMNRPVPKQGPAETWRCWMQPWGMGIQCLLLESPELTTAFGESVRSVELTLTKPQYDYRPMQYEWQRSLAPRIATIQIVADGEQLAKAGSEYASSVLRKAPKIAQSAGENGATPSRAACAAVNAKRVADLTTHDLALHSACANPTTRLFQAMETPSTLRKFEAGSAVIDIVQRSLIDGTTQSTMVLGSAWYIQLAERRSERVQALRTQYAAQRMRAGKKDF